MVSKGFRRRGDRPMKSADPVDYLDENRSQPKTRRKRNFWQLLKLPIYAAFGLAGAFLLYRSLGIYQRFFEQIGLGAIGGACRALRPFPFLGWLLQSGCDTVSQVVIGSIALVCLIALSILMSIPILLFFCPDAIASMVDQLRSNSKEHHALEVYQDDGKDVKTLVERHKRLPEGALRTLALLSVAAFAVEALIVLTVRGFSAPIWAILVDSLGLELLLCGFFSFRNAFRAKPKTVRLID